MSTSWRNLTDAEQLSGQHTPHPAGHFRPNALQSVLINLSRHTILRRGVFREKMSRLIFALGSGPLDIQFRDCLFRLFGRNNLIEHSLLLNPRYNATDIDFLLDDAARDANFIDIGSNVGLYALPLAKHAPDGTTIAIDANPLMAERLTWNAQASGLNNIKMFPVAVADQPGQGDLQIRLDDLAIVSVVDNDAGAIPIRPLADIIAEAGLNAIHGLKIDVEGHEDKALAPFIAAAPEVLLPQRIVIERMGPDSDYPACVKAFNARGYRLVTRTRNNSLYLHDPENTPKTHANPA